MRYQEKDIRFSEEGDIIIEDGNLKMTEGNESLKQDVNNRLRTNNPDWNNHNGIGADLEDLRGMKNTKETGLEGEDKIRKALTYDNRVSSADLKIKSVPTAPNEITYYNFINTGENNTLLLPFKINLS